MIDDIVESVLDMAGTTASDKVEKRYRKGRWRMVWIALGVIMAAVIVIALNPSLLA